MVALGCDRDAAICLIWQAKIKKNSILEIGTINSSDAVLVSGDGTLFDHLVNAAKSDVSLCAGSRPWYIFTLL